MAHELEVVGGEGQMFSVKETPWHKLGVVLENPPTVKEGIKAAGLNWKVEMQGLNTDFGDPVPDHRAVVRSKDQAILGIVGNTYKPLQNQEAFEWFQPFLDEGVAELESAGSLFEGRKVWVLAKIKSKGKNRVVVPGDAIEQYILLSNSHDGKSAVRVGFTPVRVVCNNTLSCAEGKRNANLVRVFHTSGVKEAIEGVRDVMDATRQTFSATLDQYKTLAAADIKTKDLERLIKLVYATSKPNEKDMDVPKKIIEKVTELFETGAGTDIKGVQGTYWGAYNAISEYNQYYRGESPEHRLNTIWFKSGQSNKNTKAFRLALQMAA